MIDWLDDAARALDRRLMVRLVKGAYWDTEVKRAQERGLPDYPVFTRKAMTDLCYIACARKLLAARPRLFPQFATHNALTVASVIEEAGGARASNSSACTAWARRSTSALTEEPGVACRVYAPVGGHRDLLAYLVRRLLENGANSSFVSVAADPSVPVADDPEAAAGLDRGRKRMRGIRAFRCRAIFMRRSAGIRRAWNSATGRALRRCSTRHPQGAAAARAGKRVARRASAACVEIGEPRRGGLRGVERDAGRGSRGRARTRRRSL